MFESKDTNWNQTETRIQSYFQESSWSGPGDRIRGKLEPESGRRSGKWTVGDGEKRKEESEEIEG